MQGMGAREVRFQKTHSAIMTLIHMTPVDDSVSSEANWRAIMEVYA